MPSRIPVRADDGPTSRDRSPPVPAASAVELAKHAADRLTEHGVEVRVPGPDADSAGLAHLAVELDHFAEGLDVVISLGGDGTMLRAVDIAYEAGVAVLGVNVGQLGYLTEIEPDDFDAALDRLLAGELRGCRAHGARDGRRVRRHCERTLVRAQ